MGLARDPALDYLGTGPVPVSPPGWSVADVAVPAGFAAAVARTTTAGDPAGMRGGAAQTTAVASSSGSSMSPEVARR